jgi:hypothetical protein
VVFAFAFAQLAWVLFALAMPRHQGAVLARRLPPRGDMTLRVTAWCLLGASFGVSLHAKGWVQGPIFWGAVLVLTAIACVLLLAFVPRHSASIAVVLAVVMCAIGWL